MFATISSIKTRKVRKKAPFCFQINQRQNKYLNDYTRLEAFHNKVVCHIALFIITTRCITDVNRGIFSTKFPFSHYLSRQSSYSK